MVLNWLDLEFGNLRLNIYVWFKKLPKPWKFYTNPVCVVCDILQFCTIGPTIHTRQHIQCLLYAGSFAWVFFFSISLNYSDSCHCFVNVLQSVAICRHKPGAPKNASGDEKWAVIMPFLSICIPCYITFLHKGHSTILLPLQDILKGTQPDDFLQGVLL